MEFVMNFGIFLVLSLPFAQAEPFSLSTDTAAAVHLSTQGLNQIGEAISMLVPSEITVAAGSNTFECSDDSTLNYTLSDFEIYPSIDEARFVPESTGLLLEVFGTISRRCLVLFKKDLLAA